MCCVDPMHSINIDNLELRWRWIYGDEHLGFKKLAKISTVLLAAKLFCVPGEAVELDGKRLALNKGLGSAQGGRYVSSSMFIVRHGMTLGEMVGLPVVKALYKAMQVSAKSLNCGLKALDHIQVAAVLAEHAVCSVWQLEGIPDNDGSLADQDITATAMLAPGTKSTGSTSKIHPVTATVDEQLPSLVSYHSNDGVTSSSTHPQLPCTSAHAASLRCVIATSASGGASHALPPAPRPTGSFSWADPNPTPAKQPKLTKAQALLVCHRDEVQLRILGESYAVQEVLLPVLYREGFSAEEKAIYSPTPLVHQGVERAMVVLDWLTQDSRGELHAAFACLLGAVPMYLRADDE